MVAVNTPAERGLCRDKGQKRNHSPVAQKGQSGAYQLHEVSSDLSICAHSRKKSAKSPLASSETLISILAAGEAAEEMYELRVKVKVKTGNESLSIHWRGIFEMLFEPVADSNTHAALFRYSS
jgi:hypothetical protein